MGQIATIDEQNGGSLRRRIVRWVIDHAKKGNAVDKIALAGQPQHVKLYQSLAFTKVTDKSYDGDEDLGGQLCLEYRCKRGAPAAKANGKQPAGNSGLASSLSRVELI